MSSFVAVNHAYRLGRVFTHLTEFEEAKIAVAGPLSNILLAILIKVFEINALKELMFVSSIIAIVYMFPFPGLDGIKVFFGSKLLYIFSIIFILTSAFLLNFINGIIVLVLCFMISLIILIAYYYTKNISKKSS